jgi:hypothetical protein
VGFWRDLWYGTATTAGVASPYAAPSSALVSLALPDIIGTDAERLPDDRATALQVPGLKRAHGIHCSIVAGLPFYAMDGDQRAAEQPGWLTNSASGVSPYHRMFGVTSDLFMHGWAALGFTADGDDALHVPFGLWGADAATGRVVIDERIPARYRARPVAIPLGYGEHGVLVDAAGTIRAARNIERAWMERVENPAPATELHFTDPQYDQMSPEDKRQIVDQWNENRRRSGGQTAVTQSFIEVKALGQTSADLFEKGRNAIRLDLANHSAVPASLIEGAKDGGGTDINYSNDGTKRNELYDFGTRKFVQAIEARLSLDDVSDPGLSIRADLSGLMAFPSPDSNPTSED